MPRRILVILAVLLVSAGCAGRDFTRAPIDSLAVGRATEAEIRQRFGAPYREGTVLKNGETMATTSRAPSRTTGRTSTAPERRRSRRARPPSRGW